MLPDFIIIGAQKSATTFIHKALMNHPEIFMPEEEVCFFEEPEYSHTSIEDFGSLFEGAEAGGKIGMKRPTYLHKEECPERISRHIPYAKLLVILRDPVERAVSSYFHKIKMGLAPLENVNSGLTKLIEGKYDDKYQGMRDVIEYGFYAKQLKRYYRYFGKDQLLVLFYHEVIEGPAKALKRICVFLGVDPEYTACIPASRRKPGVYSYTRLALLRLKNRFVYRYGEGRKRMFLRKDADPLSWVIEKTVHFLDRCLLSLFLTGGKPVLDDNVKKRLYSLYRSDIDELKRLTGADLSGWRY